MNKIYQHKKFFLFGIIFLILLFFIIHKIKENNNLSDYTNKSISYIKPIQYSDKNISFSAINTNENFKSISFLDNIPNQPKTNRDFASVVKSLKSLLINQKSIVKEEKTDKEKEYGTWVWTPTLFMTKDYMDSILEEAKANSINTIYLSIDSYLDIYEMSADISKLEEKQISGKKFIEIISYFIEKANSLGIEVDAEAGWRNWSEEGNQYKAFIIAHFVKMYNESNQFKFRGLQYDIEPYLLEYYEENKEKVLLNFISLIDQTQMFLATTSIKFSIAIPDFYDGKDGLTPKINYKNKKDFVFDHLMKILDKRDGSTAIIMSYRNFAEGTGGTIDITQNEINTLKKKGYKSNIIVAQETGDVLPEFLTFHNTSREYFENEISKIKSVFNNEKNFNGIAIHYANTFLNMK